MKANCRECNVLITNKKNVGEERNRWPGPRTDFLCMSCHLRRQEKLISRTRRELGLEEPWPGQRP